MAPVESTRVAAVAICATVGVILVALAIVKFKSKPKRRSSGGVKNGEQSSTATQSGETTTEASVQAKSGETILQPSSTSQSRETTASETTLEPAKSRDTDGAVIVKSGLSAETINIPKTDGSGDQLNKETELTQGPQISPTESGAVSADSGTISADRGILLEHVYQTEDEPKEQTVVSFAEIKFPSSKQTESEQISETLKSESASTLTHKTQLQSEMPGIDTLHAQGEATALSLSASAGLAFEDEVTESFEQIQEQPLSSFEAVSTSGLETGNFSKEYGQEETKESDTKEKTDEEQNAQVDQSSTTPKNGQTSDESTGTGSEGTSSKSDTSFETVEVAEISAEYSAQENKHTGESSGTTEGKIASDAEGITSVQPPPGFEISSVDEETRAESAANTGQEETTSEAGIIAVQPPPDLIAHAATGGDVSEAVGEGGGVTMAIQEEIQDTGQGLAGMGEMLPTDSSGDASFVVLDVATAPSNCKPDFDVVEPSQMDQSELRQSVSLERLKYNGSDSGEGEITLSEEASDGAQEITMTEPHSSWVGDLNEDEINETLNVASLNPEALLPKHAQILVAMLSTKDLEMQEKLLAIIAKVAAFTRNQNLLREAQCLPRLSQLLRAHSLAVQMDMNPPTAVVTSLANAVTNLAVNTDNNSRMEDCVPPLVDMALKESGIDSVQMASLQALTNLSVTADHHSQYTRIVQRLYDLVDSDSASIQLQSLKVMVNLSCNKEMVPHLLAAKAPSTLISLLEMHTSQSLVLRWTTLLGNIMQTVKEKQMSSSELPPDDKAASPETMYSALYGLNTAGQLRNKVFILSKHPNEDIRYQAARIYSGLMK